MEVVACKKFAIRSWSLEFDILKKSQDRCLQTRRQVLESILPFLEILQEFTNNLWNLKFSSFQLGGRHMHIYFLTFPCIYQDMHSQNLKFQPNFAYQWTFIGSKLIMEIPNNVWKLFKINNKVTKKKSVTSTVYFYYQL